MSASGLHGTLAEPLPAAGPPRLRWPQPAITWQPLLQQFGALLLDGVPCTPGNAELRALGASLGQPALGSVARRAGLAEPGGIQQVRDLGQAPPDQFGQPLLSGHRAAFALHSDEAFLALPARWVLLHCWRPDPAGGGASLLAQRDLAWARADPASRALLTSHALPYPSGNHPAIDLARDGLLRYNRAECEGAARRAGRRLAPADRTALDRIGELFEAVAVRLQLAAGTVLLLDNHRLLHGREAFMAGSPRLLKRLRIEA